MSLVYVIRKKDREQPVSDHLLLEEALQHWEAMGCTHQEHYIEVFEGTEISRPEKPIDIIYLFIDGADSYDGDQGNIDDFDVTRFM